VVLALRDKTLSAALAARFSAESDVALLVCSVLDPDCLASRFDNDRAGVLLLDERWFQRLDASSVASLRARRDLRVLLIGDRACAALAEQVVRNEFQGFLLAETAAANCVKAVRSVRRGEIWLPRALLADLLFAYLPAVRGGSVEADADTKLTLRETQIVGYVRRGFANKQIAEALAICEDTVKKHLLNAYTKLGVHRRSEIIASAGGRLAGI
jgi:DNA-binding NarL/FixJ family response regulator